jgi:hypothetical protein
LDTSKWAWYKYTDLFDIERGRLPSAAVFNEGATPFVSASLFNNGVSAYIDKEPEYRAGLITINADGTEIGGGAAYQKAAFCANTATNILIPRFTLTEPIAMFICTLIRLEKFRYNYGYKWGLDRMRKSVIKLPTKDGQPDWVWIEQFMKSIT